MNTNLTRNGPGRPPSLKDPVRTICDLAAALFAQKGYDDTSLQDIAREVGVTKAGLYHYFPTKQAIFETIVLTTLADMLTNAEEALQAQPDARGKLTGFMIAHGRYFDTRRDNYRTSFFGRAGGDMGDFTPEQLAARKAYVAVLEEVLASGVRAGTLTVPDIPSFARGILGMLNWMARWHQSDGPMTAAEIAESYATTLLAGLSTTGRDVTMGLD